LHGVEVVLTFSKPEKDVTVGPDLQGRWPRFWSFGF